jgi:hypothetical protein
MRSKLSEMKKIKKKKVKLKRYEGVFPTAPINSLNLFFTD